MRGDIMTGGKMSADDDDRAQHDDDCHCTKTARPKDAALLFRKRCETGFHFRSPEIPPDLIGASSAPIDYKVRSVGYRAVRRIRGEAREYSANLWGLPARRQFFQDRDRALFDGKIAAGDQVFHQFADHVARRADAIGDVLSRQLLGNDLMAAVGDFGERVQQPYETTIDIGEREALQVAGRHANTMDQPLDQVQREIGVRKDELTKMRAIDDGAGRWLDRDHRRGAARAIERHFADVLAGTVEIDDELASRFVAR